MKPDSGKGRFDPEISRRAFVRGRASAIAFASDGTIENAYTILSATHRNCAGGPTPWGAWLSCEEVVGSGFTNVVLARRALKAH